LANDGIYQNNCLQIIVLLILTLLVSYIIIF